MRISILLTFVILSSLCFAQSELASIELYNGQVYTYSLSDIEGVSVTSNIVGVEDEKMMETVIGSFVLHQNYPNPFNPGTTIKYEIPDHGLVEINIFDINGELVSSLSNEEQERGIHTINWDGRNNTGNLAASGIYFCRVVHKNNFLTKKMLLIK